MSHPIISIIMPVKNEIVNLRRSIPQLLNQKIRDKFEIVIIDSGSTDGSVDYIKANINNNALRLFQIEPEQFHHAKTRNLGIDLAHGKFIIFLQGDAIPKDEYWLYYLLNPLIIQGKGIAASYSRQVPKDNANINNLCRISYNYGDEPIIKGLGKNLSAKDLYFFSTASCAINKELVNSPFFDETICFAEDISLSYRIINEGINIAYCPNSIVYHSHNYTYFEVFQRYFDYGISYNKIGVYKEKANLKRDGIKYFKHSLRILKNRNACDYIKFLIFIFISYIGFKLGVSYKAIPQSLFRLSSKWYKLQ
jgi:rhamnosyltransferase